MLHKLKSQRGETLVETMASIVIATLSVALLFSCIMASVSVNRAAQEADRAYYAALSKAEAQTGAAGTAKVTVKNSSGGEAELPVLLYGGEGMYSYAKAESAP